MISDKMLDAFEGFLEVQQSGVTNMYDKSRVCELADITEEEYTYIINNYNELREAYENS